MNVVAKISGLLFLTLSLSFFAGHAQTPLDPAQLDSVQLKNVRGKIVSFDSLTKKNPVILVCFWSVNSDPSVSELNAINAQYAKWRQLASFRLVAVCVDEGNLSNRMRTTANMNGWTFDVYADMNDDLRRLLHAINTPQSIILKDGQVVYQQSGYQPGSENYLFNKLLSLAPAVNH